MLRNRFLTAPAQHAGLIVLILATAAWAVSTAGLALGSAFVVVTALAYFTATKSAAPDPAQTETASEDAAPAPELQLEAESNDLDPRVTDAIRATEPELDRIQALVADTSSTLSGAFTRLTDELRQETEAVSAIADCLRFFRDAQDPQGFERSVDAVQTAVLTSQEMVGNFESLSETIAERFARVSRSADMLTAARDSVIRLVEESHVLALNARVEAARAGENGRSFGVVAAAVRDLGVNMRQFGDSVGETIDELRTQLRAVRGIVMQMMDVDSESCMRATALLNGLVDRVRASNDTVTNGVHQIQTVRSRVDDEVASAVTALQFEDLIVQTLGQTRAHLAHVSAGRVDEPAPHRPVQQESLDEGDVELF